MGAAKRVRVPVSRSRAARGCAAGPRRRPRSSRGAGSRRRSAGAAAGRGGLAERCCGRPAAARRWAPACRYSQLPKNGCTGAWIIPKSFFSARMVSSPDAAAQPVVRLDRRGAHPLRADVGDDGLQPPVLGPSSPNPFSYGLADDCGGGIFHCWLVATRWHRYLDVVPAPQPPNANSMWRFEDLGEERHALLEVWCGSPGRSERELAELLKPVAGVLLLNLKPPVPRTREIDGVLICPHGVFTMEVKHSWRTGTLLPNANSAWKVDGQPEPQLGNPTDQARVQAQVIGPLLRGAVGAVGYVRALVLVTGDVTLDSAAPKTLPIEVCTHATVAAVVEQGSRTRSELLSSGDVNLLFGALGLHQSAPTLSELTAEGFSPTPIDELSRREESWKEENEDEEYRDDPRVRRVEEVFGTYPMVNQALSILLRIWDECYGLEESNDECYGFEESNIELRAWALRCITRDTEIGTQVANLMELAVGDENDGMYADETWVEKFASSILTAAQSAANRPARPARPGPQNS